MRGSTPLLAALLLLFLLLFFGQRQRSELLAIERQVPALQQLAARHGLDRASVMALRELLGCDLDAAAFAAACAAFAAARAGDAGEAADALAAMAAAGDEAAARAALHAADGDRALAWQRLRGRPEALCGDRFLAVRQRFARRAAASD